MAYGFNEDKSVVPVYSADSTEVIRSFNTVADMQAATDLVAGVTCRTNGFHSIKDGGAAFYIITDAEIANGIDIIELNNGLFATLVIEPELNIKKFGGSSDGQTDCIGIIDRMIEIAESGKNDLYFPSGEYGISEPIRYSKRINIKLAANAVIKALEEMPVLLFFDAPRADSLKEYDYFPCISGGTFNGNYLVETVIGFRWCIGATIKNTIIKNFTKAGIDTSYNYDGTLIPSGASNTIEDVYILNEEYSEAIDNTIGILNNGNDNDFSKVTIRDCKTGVFTYGGNKFRNVHPWLSFPQLFNGSICFSVNGNANSFDSCTCDTYQTGFYNNLSMVQISNHRFAHNKDVVGQSMINEYGATLFDCAGGTPHILLANAVVHIPTELSGFKFIDDLSTNFSNYNFNLRDIYIPTSLNIENKPRNIVARVLKSESFNLIGSFNAVRSTTSLLLHDNTAELTINGTTTAVIPATSTFLVVPKDCRPIGIIIFSVISPTDNKAYRFQMDDSGNLVNIEEIPSGTRLSFTQVYIIKATSSSPL